jgi:hypothetical protein
MTGYPNPYYWYNNYPWGLTYRPYNFDYPGPWNNYQYPQYIVSLNKYKNYEKRIVKITNGYLVSWESTNFGEITIEHRAFSTFEDMTVWLKGALE